MISEEILGYPKDMPGTRTSQHVRGISRISWDISGSLELQRKDYWATYHYDVPAPLNWRGVANN